MPLAEVLKSARPVDPQKLDETKDSNITSRKSNCDELKGGVGICILLRPLMRARIGITGGRMKSKLLPNLTPPTAPACPATASALRHQLAQSS